MSSTQPPPELSCVSVERAVSSLLRWLSSHQGSLPSGDDPLLRLVLSLPSPPSSSPFRRRLLSLPHPVRPFSTSTHSCLVVDDRSSSPTPPTVALSKICSDNIPISTVLGITSIAKDHRSFDSRKKLCRTYEVFFVDGRVMPELRRLIGKQLWGKGMTVLAVDLRNPKWMKQMRKACESATFRIGNGTGCMATVGKAGMGREKLLENVAAAARRVLELWPDVKGIYVKSDDSVALPIYQRKGLGEEERQVEEKRIKKKQRM